MDVGGISGAVPFVDEEGYSAFRLLYLKERTTPRRANLNDDYDMIKNWALQSKQRTAIVEWIKSKNKTTFVKIGENYRNCEFDASWLN